MGWTGVSAAAGVLLLTLSACGGGAADPGPDPASGRPSASSSGTSGGSSGTSTDGPTVDKVLVFIVENHSLEQMQADMPFTDGLAATYGHADHFQAMTHPSLPNYLAIAGGTTAGVTDDDPPAAHPLTGPSVFGQALAAGRTATVYADGMPEPCSLDNGGNKYVARHNPWTYHVDERELCREHDLPLGRFAADVEAGDLPDVGMVVPNQCHNAHDCPLGVADAWLRDKIEAVMAGPDWESGRLAVVVTADEDETKGDEDPDNAVLTVVAHPALHGVVVHDPLSHLSLSRALSEVAGGDPLADAASAPSLWEAFGLVPAGS